MFYLSMCLVEVFAVHVILSHRHTTLIMVIVIMYCDE